MGGGGGSPQFGHNKAESTPISKTTHEQRDAGYATRHSVAAWVEGSEERSFQINVEVIVLRRCSKPA